MLYRIIFFNNRDYSSSHTIYFTNLDRKLFLIYKQYYNEVI